MTELTKPEGFDKEAFEIGKVIHKHTIQFLSKGGEYGYKPYGSGVLVLVDNRFLILTASHVTDHTDDTPLYVNSVKGITPILGDCNETDLTKDKSVDLSYIILDEGIGNILAQSYVFIPINKIIHSHKALRSNQYLVVGYPEKNIRADVKEKKVYTGTTTFLLTMSKENVYQYYKYDENKVYILDFSGKGVDLETDEMIKGIHDPYGVSGCGLWLLKPKPGAEKLQLEYRLIGIMTEFRKGKYHVLIGTKVEILIDALIQVEHFRIKR